MTGSGQSVIKPSFVAVTKISQKVWNEEASMKAIKIEIELNMLFDELKALLSVKRASILAGTKIPKSHMFVVAKYLASGEFDKLKAQLLADRRDQDADLCPNKTLPMAVIYSVLPMKINIKKSIYANANDRRTNSQEAG
jgi:hypothetical protein